MNWRDGRHNKTKRKKTRRMENFMQSRVMRIRRRNLYVVVVCITNSERNASGPANYLECGIVIIFVSFAAGRMNLFFHYHRRGLGTTTLRTMN